MRTSSFMAPLVLVASLSLGCAATMDSNWGRRSLADYAPMGRVQGFQVKQYPMQRATLDKARKDIVPLMCDANGPVDDKARSALKLIADTVAALEPGGCKPGQGKLEAGQGTANRACVHLGAANSTTTTFAVTCADGKVTVTMDSGTHELATLHGQITGSLQQLLLTGWDANRRQLFFAEALLSSAKGNSSLRGGFVFVDVSALTGPVAEIIPAQRSDDDAELFVLRADGVHGISVSAPVSSDDLVGGTMGFNIAGFRLTD